MTRAKMVTSDLLMEMSVEEWRSALITSGEQYVIMDGM